MIIDIDLRTFRVIFKSSLKVLKEEYGLLSKEVYNLGLKESILLLDFMDNNKIELNIDSIIYRLKGLE